MTNSLRVAGLPRRLLILFSICASARAEDPVYLEGPSGVKKEEMEAVAATIQKRIAELKMSGVTVKVIEEGSAPSIRVDKKMSWKDGERVDVMRLGRVKGEKVEVLLTLRLYDEILEKYAPGPWGKPSEDDAPKGARWCRAASPEFMDVRYKEDDELTEQLKSVVLVRKSPAAEKADFGKFLVDSRNDQALFEMSKKSTTEMMKSSMDDATVKYEGMVLVLDGRAVLWGLTRDTAVVLPMADGSSKFVMPLAPGRALNAILKHPMDMALRVRGVDPVDTLDTHEDRGEK